MLIKWNYYQNRTIISMTMQMNWIVERENLGLIVSEKISGLFTSLNNIF